MQLHESLAEIKKCRVPDLEDYSTLQIITEKEFFYPAPLRQIQKDEKSRFVLFSAPGAVGKTSLAKYIAREYGGLYWNLSSTPLGGRAFAGEIAHAAGLGRGGERQDAIIRDLKHGKALFVLDAFDEAALISKRDGLKDFLLEIGNALVGAESPSIVLTARTEKAQEICSICAEFGFGITHYYIDYFEEEVAPDFIRAYLETTGTRITPVLEDQIAQYVNDIKGRLDINDDIRSFIGYAQVLAILSRQVEEEIKSNGTLKHSTLSGETRKEKDLIYNIIQKLIIREAEKLSAFRESIRLKYEKLGQAQLVDELYCKHEQLVRLQCFILFDGMISVDDYGLCKELLPDDQIAYGELLNEWLPQHVFLRNRKVMPVFYDYLLAESLLDPDLSLLVDEYKSKLPTRVFMDCYLSLNHGCVNSEHVYYLDLAYSSQVTIGSKAYCDISASSADADDLNLYLTLTKDHGEKESNISAKIIRKPDSPICLSRAENMSVNVDGKVVLEQGFLTDVTIRQATIECDQLELNADEILFESYGDEENVIIVHEGITRKANSKIQLRGTKKAKIDLPSTNIDQYRRIFYELSQCFHSFDSDEKKEDCDDICDFVFALKKVLEQFKTDNYNGDPAKHKEKIDARCHTGCKARVLAFLKDVGLIYEEGVLYKARLTRMDELKINRVAYTHLQYNRLDFIYGKYCEWFSQM